LINDFFEEIFMKRLIETWHVDNIIELNYVPDFLTGNPSAMRPALSGTVSTKAAGEHIVRMFGGSDYARLDYWPENRSPIQVIVGTDLEYRWALEALRARVVQAGNNIAPQLIADIKKEFPVRPEKVTGRAGNKKEAII